MNKIVTLIVTALTATVLTTAPALANRPDSGQPSPTGNITTWDVVDHVTYRHEQLSMHRAGLA